MKPLKRVKTEWSAELAYCIGLIASDGNLSKDGRHITLVSKDLDQIKTFRKCLGLSNLIAIHSKSSYNPSGVHYRIQFGDINFYNFLLSIGLSPAKSKVIGELAIPANFFADFLRGSFDGDGTFYSYFDKCWKSSHMYYISFISASLAHINWIRKTINNHLGLMGYMNKGNNKSVFQIRYAKKEALQVIKFIYYKPDMPYLERKYRKVYTALDIDSKNNDARVL